MERSTFQMVRSLGEGAFGKVYLVKNRGDYGSQQERLYAMKVIDLTKSSQDERDAAIAESKVLKSLSHEHILKFITTFEDKGALCIVTEFCDSGDLADYIEKQNGQKLRESRVVMWFKEICSALKYLHDRSILHRDIKTQNVFLHGEELHTKLGDLGLAKVLERPTAKAVTFCGSPYYMSPELFSCKAYDHKSDIWALGVVIYEIATLDRPFDAILMQQLVFKVVNGGLPPMPEGDYSERLIHLMKKMLEKNADDRPSAKELLADSLFQHVLPARHPPPLPPKLNAQKVLAAREAGKTLKAMIAEVEPAIKINPLELLQTLTETYREMKQGKIAVAPDEFNNQGAVLVSFKPVDDKFKAATYRGKRNKFEGIDQTIFKKSINLKKGGACLKEEGQKPVPCTEFAINLEEEEDTAAGMQTMVETPDPYNMMHRVVHTLTNIFPNKDEDDPGFAFNSDFPKDDPEAGILYQIEKLQQHCCGVIQSLSLFQKAYELLDQEDDEMKLEEKLIKLLSLEVFGKCGVQLLYCKTFEHNLQKLKDGGRGVSHA